MKNEKFSNKFTKTSLLHNKVSEEVVEDNKLEELVLLIHNKLKSHILSFYYCGKIILGPQQALLGNMSHPEHPQVHLFLLDNLRVKGRRFVSFEIKAKGG